MTADDATPNTTSPSGRLQFWNLGVLLPSVMGFIYYYAFTTNFPSGGLSEAGYRGKWYGGVFQFRVLGREALLGWYHLLQRALPESTTFKKQGVWSCLDGEFSPLFYFSICTFNTLFLIATMLSFNRAVGMRPGARPAPGQLFASTAALLLIVASLYKVTPYDLPSYACLAAGIWLLGDRVRLSAGRLAGVLVLIAAGTAVRESMALLLSLRLAQGICRFGGKGLLSDRQARPFLAQLAAMGAVFGVVYAALRVVIGKARVIDAFTVGAFARPATLVGLAFAAGAWSLATATLSAERARLARWFVICSVPYLLTLLVAADLFEVRLYIPVVLAAMAGTLLRDAESAGQRPERSAAGVDEEAKAA
jgi:hypothetical protein